MRKILFSTLFLSVIVFSSSLQNQDDDVIEVDLDAEADKYPHTYSETEFYKLYENPTDEHPEIVIAKRYFPTKEATVDKERYKVILKVYIDGTVHEQEIDPAIAQEAHLQMEEWVDKYVETEKKEAERFTLHDLFKDIVQGDLHQWIERVFPENDPDIEPDL